MDARHRNLRFLLALTVIALCCFSAGRSTAGPSAAPPDAGQSSPSAAPGASEAPSAEATSAIASGPAALNPAGRPTRIVVLAVCAIVLLIFVAIVLAGQVKFLIVGEDNRYSNSKFQMAVWFGVLVVIYTATLWLRWWKGDHTFGGIGIPTYLFALSGASAFTLGAAKGITSNKQAMAVQTGTTGKLPALSPRFPYDLLHNDNDQVDFGDFQMFLITLLAAGVYLVQVFQFLGQAHGAAGQIVSLPDVDSTLLAAFGLGQGAYLAKKYAGNPGEA